MLTGMAAFDIYLDRAAGRRRRDLAGSSFDPVAIGLLLIGLDLGSCLPTAPSLAEDGRCTLTSTSATCRSLHRSTFGSSSWRRLASLLSGRARDRRASTTIYQRSVPIKDLPPPQTFPQPRVTTSQAEVAERERLASEQKQRLDTWRWADAEHTLVQIPIDRAMQLLAQRGNDAWAPLLPAEPALSSPTAPRKTPRLAPPVRASRRRDAGAQP